MSQQYGPAGQGQPGQGSGPWTQPGNAPGGQPGGAYGGHYGGQPGPPPAPSGPFGYPPGHQFDRKPKSNLPRILVIAGGALAVLLVILGIVLLATHKSDQPAAQPGNDASTPSDSASDSPSASPTETKGPNDVGVEVGHGVWFTPQPGWQKDPEQRAGASYILPRASQPGKIDGWFWARQSELRNAKDFAQHLADIESQNLEHVVIRQGHYWDCRRPSLMSCYAINYSAVVRSKTGKAIIVRGQIQSFQDHQGITTATDTALRADMFAQRYPDIKEMIQALVRSV